MADDRITQRERGYASSLEAQIAAATRGALAAHRESMHDYFDFINLIESSEQPNLVFSYAFLAGTSQTSGSNGSTQSCGPGTARVRRTEGYA